MNFKDIKLDTQYLDSTQKLILPNGQEIHIRNYLPISDKNDLITISLQKAEEDGSYNEVLLDVFFHLNILYLYTDIDFSDEDRADEFHLYDILETNGIIDDVISKIEDDYTNLKELLVTTKAMKLKYENSAAAVFRKFVTDLPAAAAAAAEIVDNFNPEQYNAVRDFAIAANGGRDINTNLPTEPIQKVPIKPLPQPQDHLKKTPQRKIVSVQSANKKD